MNNDNYKGEYGLIILKPDGVKKNLIGKLISLIINNKLKIIQIREKMLYESDIYNYFTSPFNSDIYAKYMTSGPIIAILVFGTSAGIKLRNIKAEFRERHGYSSKNMENLVHSADHGNEYNLQFNLLFPEKNICSYSAYADLAVSIDGHDNNIISDIKKIQNDTNLSCIGLKIPAERKSNVIDQYYKSTDKELKLIYGITKEFNFMNRNIEIVGYLPFTTEITPNISINSLNSSISEYIKWIISNGGIPILGYIPYYEIDERFLINLKEQGLCGVHIYDIRRTLYEAEELEDIVYDNELIYIGGSNGIVKPGDVSIGKYEFDLFTSKLI